MNTPIQTRHAHNAPPQRETSTTMPQATRNKIGNIVTWRMEPVVSPDLQKKTSSAKGDA